MVINQTAVLVRQEFTVNDVGDQIPTETKRTVFVGVKSVGLKRKMEAQTAGLKIAHKLVLSDETEYQGEEIVEYNGERLNIVDVFVNENHGVELATARF